jgi:hypothetical protein
MRGKTKDIEKQVRRRRGDFFSYSVAVSGSATVVGAPWADSTGRRNTSIWRCAGGTSKRVDTDGKTADAVAGPTAVFAARAPGAVLGGGGRRGIE